VLFAVAVLATLPTAIARYTNSTAVASNSFGAATLQPPTGLGLSSSCPGATVTATWTATASTFATGYTLVRTSGGTVQNTISVSGRTTVTQNDTNVPNGTYTYELQSVVANWTSVVASASTTVSCSSAPPITNPGFESGLTGWTCSANDTVITSPVHTGSQAAQATFVNPDKARCSQTITGLTPDTQYTFKIWEASGGFVVGTIGVTIGGSTNSSGIGVGAAWAQNSVSFTPGAGQTSATIWFETGGSGTVYFDDATLTSP
jgi:hypothetical protein